MSGRPSLEQYKKNIEARDFKAYKCAKCGAVIAPPVGVCYSCGGTQMEWTGVSGKGKLVSYTVIHVAPEQFQDEAPYYIGIVELEEGTRITVRLTGLDPQRPAEVKIGMPMVLDYDTGKSGRTYLAFRPA